MANGMADKNVETLAELDELPQAELIEAITNGLPASLARELARKLEANSGGCGWIVAAESADFSAPSG